MRCRRRGPMIFTGLEFDGVNGGHEGALVSPRPSAPGHSICAASQNDFSTCSVYVGRAYHLGYVGQAGNVVYDVRR
eukprot:3850929-Pyramimonas_sp.AAC.1